MYDIEDPVVKYYDFTLANCPREEIDYYVDEAVNAGDKTVDLCCGSGILSLEIAKKIQKVYAIDFSESMLGKLRNKLNGIGNIEIIQADMESFSIEEKVDSVICRDAFFHSLSSSSQRKTLKNIHNCLKNNGLLTFNIHFPNPNFLAYTLSDEAKKYQEKGNYNIPGTANTLIILQALENDLSNQILTTKLKYLTMAGSSVIKEEYSEWKARYTHLYELFYLLEISGFSVVEKFGWYDRKPWNLDNMIIIKAVKNL